MQRSARKLVQGSVVLSLAVSSLLLHLPTASADDDCLYSTSDLDHDGRADVVVGAPGGSGHGGAVQIQLSNEDEPFTRTITGVAGFGSAVAFLNANDGSSDRCSSLVVGSPDEGTGGVVHVYEWDGTSEFVSRGVFAPQTRGVGGTNQPGARFGAALAADHDEAENAGFGQDRLYVGSPGFDVDGVRDAGRVTSFVIDGGDKPTAHLSEELDYGPEYMPGPPSVGGKLGSSLSVGGGLVAAGAPGQTAGGVAGAGTVLVMRDQPVYSDDEPASDRGPADSDDLAPLELSQATPGIPGAPEKGDRFGAAVQLSDNDVWRSATLAIGAPGEDLGHKANAGAVTVARMSTDPATALGTVRSVDQDSAGMAGKAEAGDALGSALTNIGEIEAPLFLVGSPGEDVGRARNAGMVQTIGGGTGWTQKTKRMPGKSETGDRMGASLGGSVGAGGGGPVIGVPGEDSSTGAVILGLSDKHYPHYSPGYLKGTKAGGRYGFAVAD